MQKFQADSGVGGPSMDGQWTELFCPWTIHVAFSTRRSLLCALHARGGSTGQIGGAEEFQCGRSRVATEVQPWLLRASRRVVVVIDC